MSDPGRAVQQAAGRISAASSARLGGVIQRLLVGGRIGARAWLGGHLAQHLAGRISVAASGSLAVSPVFLPLLQFSGQITVSGRATGGAAFSPLPILAGGSITATGVAQLADGGYVTALAGQTHAATALQGVAGPWQPLTSSRIFAAVTLALALAEIQEPLPPKPLPFPTYNVDDYLDKITSEHNQRPKYLATVSASVEPVVEDQQLVAGLSGLFDLDYCVGEQEDFTGQWIGKSRWIELPAVFFSWDEEGLGWNQANWKGAADADTALERLDDYHYRLLLYANVIANHWDGSIPSAYEAWDTLFHYTGLKVIIQDYGNMTMLYGLLSTSEPDIVLLSLFTTGQMDLRPEGIELRAYALQPTPNVSFFAWDASSESVQGWDTGYWGLMLTPGQAYIPGIGTIWDAPGMLLSRTTETPLTLWDDGNTRWDVRSN